MQKQSIFKIVSKFTLALLVATQVLLTGCGSAASTTTGASAAATTPASPTIGIALTDPTTLQTTTSTPANVKATVLDANGAPVANTVVTFTVASTTLVTISPSSGTALTNGSGIATVSVNAASASANGATTLSASAQVSGSTVTGSIGIAVNGTAPVATPGNTVTISAPAFGANPLSAYGTTSATANVLVNGVAPTTPMTVTFSSICASEPTASGTGTKAVLTSSATTSASGTVTVSYRDNGCAKTDTVTATVAGTTVTNSAPLTVNPPDIGALQFVAASPTTIALQGTGGQTTSTVQFKVVDSAGNPLSGTSVTMTLSTSVGGITMSTATATSDGAGLVQTIVSSGTISTPVRVTASAPGVAAGTTLNTQSSQLTITTGIPDQDSFSLAASTINTEGWFIDGLTSTLTARLSDHFNNPAPDGTTINFTTEGGSVFGTCSTVNGACTTTFTTQQPRPSNGRVTVLAYAVGEESFTDLDGDGLADLAPNEMLDANGNSTDMPEAFVDYNEDGIRQSVSPNEPFIDFNSDGTFNAADGKFNGVLCNETAGSSAGTCSTSKSIHVRRSIVLTLSSSQPAPLALFDNSSPPASATSISLPACDNPGSTMPSGPVTRYYVRIVDVNGNAMPAGTIISFATSNGTLVSSPSFTVANTSGCSAAFSGCTASVASALFEYYPVDLQSDATYAAGACTNAKTSGVLTVTVKTPGGSGVGSTTTPTTITVTD